MSTGTTKLYGQTSVKEARAGRNPKKDRTARRKFLRRYEAGLGPNRKAFR